MAYLECINYFIRISNLKIDLECIFRLFKLKNDLECINYFIRISNLKNNFSRLFKLKIDLECWCG